MHIILKTKKNYSEQETREKYDNSISIQKDIKEILKEIALLIENKSTVTKFFFLQKIKEKNYYLSTYCFKILIEKYA